ncbi:MAG: NUDIX domain-containing protein [Candidatus Marsarchaeota archaeon]|nr:NUDIX domain-containing protein [Candidatus Marsarchaeota archaeon]MCL5102331.1 NUDIX domain-containing protein [Candidatus Marsarchaeota archaeon]
MHLEYSAGFVIYKKSESGLEFLFLRKSNSDIDIPKGHIEKGENALRAAIRETREETGLEVKPDPFFNMRRYYWFRFGGDTVKKYLTVFLSPYIGGEVRISSEHKGYEWIEPEKAVLEYKKRGYNYDHIEESLRYIEKREKLDKINAIYAKLPESDPNWSLSKKLVKGEGPSNARIMVVGQAPGANEDATGRPFVGRAGKLLDSLLRSAGIMRKKAYITSVVQFFPYGNRMPTDHEVELCKPFLKEQISVIKPKLIITLGSLSSEVLCGVKSIKSNHGTVTEIGGIKYFSTLHPAAAVRIKTNMPIIKGDFEKLKPLAKEALSDKKEKQNLARKK